MKRNEIKTMLSAIDKHSMRASINSKDKNIRVLADCVLALSTIIEDIMKL